MSTGMCKRLLHREGPAQTERTEILLLTRDTKPWLHVTPPRFWQKQTPNVEVCMRLIRVNICKLSGTATCPFGSAVGHLSPSADCSATLHRPSSGTSLR